MTLFCNLFIFVNCVDGIRSVVVHAFVIAVIAE